MKGDRIKYREGFKYQLYESYRCMTRIKGIEAHLLDIDTQIDWISLNTDGEIFIREGYAWDGPSGPTVDTPDFMRGSLVHDALYQLMRENKIPLTCRDLADQELRDICIEDGMSHMYAHMVYAAVSEFAESSARPQDDQVIIAP